MRYLGRITVPVAGVLAGRQLLLRSRFARGSLKR